MMASAHDHRKGSLDGHTSGEDGHGHGSPSKRSMKSGASSPAKSLAGGTSPAKSAHGGSQSPNKGGPMLKTLNKFQLS